MRSISVGTEVKNGELMQLRATANEPLAHPYGTGWIEIESNYLFHLFSYTHEIELTSSENADAINIR